MNYTELEAAMIEAFKRDIVRTKAWTEKPKSATQ